MASCKHEKLANDLLKMVDNQQLGDLILVCEDGVEVHACRMVLAARSLFFRQMLLNGMAESREKSVALPTVSSSVLAIVLKFLYAEVLLDEDIQNKNNRGKSFRFDWELLLKVVVAVRFFMLEELELEKIIIERLWSDVPKINGRRIDVLNAHERNTVACNLSILCEYSMLWNADEVKVTDDVFCPHPVRVESIEVICFHLMQIMVFSELSAATLFNVSRKAFHFYLSKTQRTSSDQTWDWSLEEYLRLREIITWCAVRAAETVADIENVDRKCLPGPRIALEFLRECVKSIPGDFQSTLDFSEGRESFVQSILKEDMDEFLRRVDLVSIHPELLVTVIEPLDLIDPLDLYRTYSVQAMRGSRRSREIARCQDTDVWHLAGYGVYSLRTRFSNSLTFTVSVNPRDDSYNQFSVVSAAGLKMGVLGDTFEWEIVATPHGYLAGVPMDLLEIGFYRLRSGEGLSMEMGKHRLSPLSGSPRGTVLSISATYENCSVKFFDKTSLKHPPLPFPLLGYHPCHASRPIRVTVNRVEGTCSFLADVHELTFPIDNAKDEIFYPVILISSHLRGDCRPHYDRLTVKIQNLKGFDQSKYVNPAQDDYLSFCI